QHLHAVQSNGRPACLVMAFPVAGGKILDAAPERRAQVIILQFVPHSAPSGYACHIITPFDIVTLRTATAPMILALLSTGHSLYRSIGGAERRFSSGQ